MEFAELRDYYPGDDLRRLDWKAYGRSDKFFLKEYESETNARIYFLIDTSGSMNFQGADGVTRLHFCKQITATLSALFLFQADAVGVPQVKENYMVTPLHRGDSGLQFILQELDEVSATGKTMLSEQIHKLTEQIPRRSMVVVLSDFFTSTDELKSAFEHLNHCRHEVSLLQVLSNQEINLPDMVHTSFKDLETDKVIKTSPEKIRAEYKKKLNAHQQELKKIAAQNRAGYFQLIMEEGVEKGINSFMQFHQE